MHVAWGKDPVTGKVRIADGVVAIGQFAKGDIAIGQFAYGKYFALGQFAASLGLAIGQFAIAPLCVAMLGAGLFTLALVGVGFKMFGMVGISLWDLVRGTGGVLVPAKDG